MKKALFAELLQSVREAAAIERGTLKPSRTFEARGPRTMWMWFASEPQLGLSQTQFATLLGISEDTLQNWEQGRRRPTGPAKVLLKVAARHPRVILEAAA